MLFCFFVRCCSCCFGGVGGLQISVGALLTSHFVLFQIELRTLCPTPCLPILVNDSPSFQAPAGFLGFLGGLENQDPKMRLGKKLGDRTAGKGVATTRTPSAWGSRRMPRITSRPFGRPNGPSARAQLGRYMGFTRCRCFRLVWLEIDGFHWFR